jgi:hypothetical protein
MTVVSLQRGTWIRKRCLPLPPQRLSPLIKQPRIRLIHLVPTPLLDLTTTHLNLLFLSLLFRYVLIVVSIVTLPRILVTLNSGLDVLSVELFGISEKLSLSGLDPHLLIMLPTFFCFLLQYKR